MAEKDLMITVLTQLIILDEFLRNEIQNLTSSSSETMDQHNYIHQILSSIENTISLAKHFILINGLPQPVQLDPAHSILRECSLGVDTGTPTNEASSSHNKKKRTRGSPNMTFSGLEGPPNDGHKWRKYGKKIIKGDLFPRDYYRCHHWFHIPKLCYAKIQVQKIEEDPQVFRVTYKEEHTCGTEIHLDQTHNGPNSAQLPQLVFGPNGEENEAQIIQPSFDSVQIQTNLQPIGPLSQSNQEEINTDPGQQSEYQSNNDLIEWFQEIGSKFFFHED